MRDLKNGNDQDAAETLKALRRAARRALELGRRTGTPVYVIKDHHIVDLTKQDLKQPERIKPLRVRP